MKGLAWLGGIAAAILVVFLMWNGGYSQRVRSYEAGVAQLSQVQNVQQRQFDLIPNLVTVTREFADHERAVYTQVTEARAKVGQMNLDVSKLAQDPAALQRLIDAQNSFAGAMSRLIAVAEQYPNVKANDHYLALQSEVAGSVNRIAVERRRYIEIARDHNASLKTNFGRWFYSGSFQMLAQFEANPTATQPFTIAPKQK